MGMTIEAIEINRQFPVYQDQILRDLRKKTLSQNDTVGKSLENQNNSFNSGDESDTTPQNQTDPIENPKSYYEGGLDQAESVINNEQLKFDKQPEYKPPSNSSEATGSLTPGGKAPGQSGPPKEFTDADEKIKHSGLTRRDGTTIPATAGPNAADLFKIFCNNTIVYAQDQIVRYGNTTTGGSEGTTQAESYGDNLNKSSEEKAAEATVKDQNKDALEGSFEGTVISKSVDENGVSLGTAPQQHIINAVDAAARENGVEVVMTPNGGKAPRSSGTQNHPGGHAMDFYLTKNGQRLPYSNPAYESVISSLVKNGKNSNTNIGIGRYPDSSGYGFIHYDETPASLNPARNNPVSQWPPNLAKQY